MSQAIQPPSVTIEGRQSGPALLLTGGVHGDEYEPMEAVRRLAAAISPCDLCGKVVLVPVANPPAFARKHRCGPDDLDLARAFPGRPDGSVTQQIAHALTGLIAGSDYYIDLHTGGAALQLVPLVGYMLHRDGTVLERQRRMARAFGLPVIWGTTSELQGRSLSAARDAGVPAIYAEWGGGGRCDPQGIETYVAGCLNVMAELGMINRMIPASDVRHVVEDARAGSGYLQVQNPSPCAGFFLPGVRLGQVVRPGECLGSVQDELGEVCERIVCSTAGIVICLRTLPRVEKDESLAVILETGEGQT